MPVDYALLDGQVSDAANELVIDHATYADAGQIERLAGDLAMTGPDIRGADFHGRLVDELRRRAAHVRAMASGG